MWLYRYKVLRHIKRIHSTEKLIFLQNYVLSSAEQDLYWIGLTRSGLGPWYWGTGDLASWTFWDADEPGPNADEECCIAMFDQLAWGSAECVSVLPSLCQEEGKQSPVIHHGYSLICQTYMFNGVINLN